MQNNIKKAIRMITPVLAMSAFIIGGVYSYAKFVIGASSSEQANVAQIYYSVDNKVISDLNYDLDNTSKTLSFDIKNSQNENVSQVSFMCSLKLVFADSIQFLVADELLTITNLMINNTTSSITPIASNYSKILTFEDIHYFTAGVEETIPVSFDIEISPDASCMINSASISIMLDLEQDI